MSKLNSVAAPIKAIPKIAFNSTMVLAPHFSMCFSWHKSFSNIIYSTCGVTDKFYHNFGAYPQVLSVIHLYYRVGLPPCLSERS